MGKTIHEVLPAEVEALQERRLQEQIQVQSRQQVKHFLQLKALDFINQHQAVPCSRASRRKAARDIAKRYLKKVLSEEAQNADV